MRDVTHTTWERTKREVSIWKNKRIKSCYHFYSQVRFSVAFNTVTCNTVQRRSENSWLPQMHHTLSLPLQSPLMLENQNSPQFMPTEWVKVYTVTKDPWLWAKSLNAQIKHLLFEQGNDIFISDWALNRPSVSHKNRCLLHPGWGPLWFVWAS